MRGFPGSPILAIVVSVLPRQQSMNISKAEPLEITQTLVEEAQSVNPAQPREEAENSTSGAWLRRNVPLLIALPFAIQAVDYLRLLLQIIVARNEGDYPEGAVTYGLLTFFHTGSLFLLPFKFPWNGQVYGPLFVMVGAFFAWLLHGKPAELTVLMRSLSLAALLGSVAIVGYLCWRLEGRKIWTAIAVIFGLGCFWLVPFAACVRPDLIAIFLVFAALAAYRTAEENPLFCYLAGILAVLSFFTKQNTAAVLLALVIDQLWARKFKEAGVFIAGGVTAAIWILLPLWLRHEPFLANFTLIRSITRDWFSIPDLLVRCLRINEIAVVPIFIAVLGATLIWKETKYRGILLVTVFAWASNVAALANEGGDYNYMLLPWLLTMLFVPAGLRQLERWAAHSLWIHAGLFCLAMIAFFHQSSHLAAQPPTAIDTSIVSKLKVLTDNSYLELQSGQPQLLDPWMYNDLAKQKAWSDEPIRQKIDAEDYDVLLLSGKDGSSDSEFLVEGYRGTSFWGADVLREMTLHYRVLCEAYGNFNHLALVPMDRRNFLSRDDLTELLHQSCRVTNRRPQVIPGFT